MSRVKTVETESSDRRVETLPTTMKAIVIRAFGDPEVLTYDDVPIPETKPGRRLAQHPLPELRHRPRLIRLHDTPF